MTQAGKSVSQTQRKTAAGGADRLRTIGQVVRELQPDFPDLSITKIRYLEDRGLLSPARTEGRYRKYSNADVRTLRTILTLQRDDYLPLEVIRQRLQRLETTAGAGALVSTGGPARSSLALRREDPAYSANDICEATGVDRAFLSKLEEFRLIESAGSTGAVFTESDLETVRICQLLARFQVEPRNLRLLSSSAEREAALIEQVAATSLRSTHADRREFGLQMVEDLGALFSQLLHLLLYKELRRLL